MTGLTVGRIETRVASGHFRIPAELDDSGLESLRSLALVNAGAPWATAACVYAWTEPGQGQRTDLGETSPKLTISDFADLRLRGLSSRKTVRRYRRAWEHAVEQGWAEAAEPGAAVTLPERDFAFAPKLREVSGGSGNEVGAFNASSNGSKPENGVTSESGSEVGAAVEGGAPNGSQVSEETKSTTDGGAADPDSDPEDQEVDALAEWERAEEELAKALELIEALQSDDVSRKLAELHEKYARLEGRLRQEMKTRRQAERQASYFTRLLKEIARSVGVEDFRAILPAIEALQ